MLGDCLVLSIGYNTQLTNSANIVGSGQSDISFLAPIDTPAKLEAVVLVSPSNEQHRKIKVCFTAIYNTGTVSSKVGPIDIN